MVIQRAPPDPPPKRRAAGGSATSKTDKNIWTVGEWGRAASQVSSRNLKGAPIAAIALIHGKGVAIYTGSGTIRQQIARADLVGKRDGWYRALNTGPGRWLWLDMEASDAGAVLGPFGSSSGKAAEQLAPSVEVGESVVFVFDSAIVLRADPVDAGKPQRTAGAQAWADGVAARVSKAWKDPAPAERRSVLPGPPKVWTRHDDQAGWHVRFSLDGVEGEVGIAPGDKQADVDARVRRAVTQLRAKFDPAATPLPPGLKPPPAGGRHDPKAGQPPEWWVPFEVHPSQQGGEGIANAPALPARVEMQAHPEESAPKMVAGAAYDFAMKVQWTDDLHGLASAMSYGYYWETLAATSADWAALAGVPDPSAAVSSEAASSEAAGSAGASAEGAAPVRAAPVGGAAPNQTGAKSDSAVNTKTGSGTKVGRYEGATRDTQYTKRDASHDIASTWEDDRVAVVGEAVAGGYKVAKTWVVDVFRGVTKKDDVRSIKLDAPGYYLVRCTAWNTGATAASKFVRAASVHALPVTVTDPNRVAAEGAREELKKAPSTGAFGRYHKEVADWERRLRGATLLAARRAAPATAVERLSEDELTALARRPATGAEPDGKLLTDDEHLVRTALEVEGMTLAEYGATAKAQVEQLTADGHSKLVGEWWNNLKEDEVGARDVPLGASFVKERTGERVDLKLMLGQAKDSTDARPHWLLYDITSPETRDEYSGTTDKAGPAGHLASIRSALRAFGGGTPYGRGTFGLAWPSSIGSLATTGLPVLLASEPDKDQRSKSRHQAYIDIATWVVPVAKVAKLGKIAAVLETLAAVGGGIQAIDALRKRARTGHLYDIGTLLEVVQVLGAVRAGGAAATGVLRSAKVIKEAKQVQEGISLLVKLDTGVQLMMVTHSVVTCLDEAKTGTPERQVLQGTYCIAKGIHDGTVTLHAVTAPHYAADEPATGTGPAKAKAAPHGTEHDLPTPGVKKSKDGREQVEVHGGAIEVCPVQRACPTLRHSVGDRIHDTAVADKVRAAEKAATSGHPAEAATDAAAALDRARLPRSTRAATGGDGSRISKKAQKLLDKVAAASKAAPGPIVAELLDDLGSRIKDRRTKLTREQVDAELLRVPALAEVVAQRRAWEKDTSRAKELAVLDDLEFGLRSGKLKRADAFEYLDRLRKESGGPATGSPTGSVRERLSARHPDVGGRFAEADAAFAKKKGEGPPPSARFDAAMAVLEKAGLGDEGRAVVDSLFRPGGRADAVSAGRFAQATETLARVAALVSERPDLATTSGQRKYQNVVEGLGNDVANAYRKGVTLEGRPITNKNAPELVEAMTRMDKAFADQKATGDPVARLLGMLHLRDEVARAGEILRTYDPRFTATETAGKARASKQLAGAHEQPISVTASGPVGEPLARDLPGVGLERYTLLPDEIGALPTVPRSLARRLAALVSGYHRAHLIGPGFGGELIEGLMLAPKSVNLGAQNEGVEAYIRYAKAAGLEPTVKATASGRRIVLPVEGGTTEHVDLLTKVDYRITLKDGTMYKVVIEVGSPPGGETAIHSTIPADAPGGDVLRPPKDKKRGNQ